MKTALRRIRLIALVTAACVAVYGVLAGLVAPPLARKMLMSRLEERLGRTVVIDDLSVNPYTLRAVMRGFRVLERDGKTPFVSFDTLDVTGGASSVYRLAPVVDALTVKGLEVHLVRDAASHYNASDILDRLNAAQAAGRKAEGKPAPFRFAVANIRLVDGAIDFDDRPAGTVQRVSAIQLAIPYLSNLPAHVDQPVQPAFSANINGTPFQLTGEALPFENTVRTNFHLDVQALDVPRYFAYLPADLPVRITAGKLDAHLALRFAQTPGDAATMDVAGTAALDGASLATAEGPLGQLQRVEVSIASLDPVGGAIQIASLRVADAAAMADAWKIGAAEARDIAIDTTKHSVHVASIATSGGRLAVKRDADGSVEFPRMPSSGTDSAKWDVKVDKLAVEGYAITVLDGTLKPAVTHDLVLTKLEGEDLSTEDGMKGRASAQLRVGKGGALDATSTFALEPLRIKATVDARSIDLVPLRAYASEFRTVAMKGGSASAKGTLTVEARGRGMRIAYEGSAEIANLATRDTLNNEELLDWKSVRTSGMKLAYATDAPFAFSAAEMRVDKAYSRIFVSPEGKLNLQQLRTATAAGEEPAPTRPAPARNVRIDRILFLDSRLNFTDHYIKPNYTADVGGLHGSVTNLTSDPQGRANLALLGTWDGVSPVAIAGSMNPLAGDLFLDVAAKGQDIDLTKLSAYSERYAGYGIKEGRLTLDVKYHIEDGKMEGRNRILVDHLTFGDKVESPDATKLPVLFAINLLKDANGRIDLELPISGSLEDPKFELGAIIAQMFRGPFAKAASSPFSLIAGGAGGEDLAFVEFEPGASALTATAREKLDALAKALRDRPGLKLEIAAHADDAQDMNALKSAALKRRLEAAPKNLSKEAREKLMQQPIEIGQAELAALAAQRAGQVKAYLVTNGQLAAERIVLAGAPQPEQGIAAAKAHPSRVDFALR